MNFRSIQLKVPSFSKWMVWCTVVCISFVVGVIAYAAEDDDYMLLLNSVKDSTGALMGSFLSDKTSSRGPSSKSNSGVNNADVGKLNLDLIDRIPDVNSGKVGYIKELLSIYRDSEHGKLNSGFHLPVCSLLGMHTNEVGGGGSLPPYYFKASSWKKNKPNYCLMDFTSKSLAAIGNSGGVDESGGYGVFQNTSGAYSDPRSKVNPLTVARGSSGKQGDTRFLPDMIAISADKGENCLNYLDKKVLDGTQTAMIGTLANNRGEAGAISCMMGVLTNGAKNHRYKDDLHGVSHWTTLKKTATQATAGYVLGMLADYTKEHTDFNAKVIGEFDSLAMRAGAAAIAMHNEDWYVNTYYVKYVKRYASTYVKAWNALYPKDKKNNSSIVKVFEKHQKSLPDAIREVTGTSVSPADCLKVYSTSGNYDDSGCYEYFTTSGGGIFHVTKTRDTDGAYTHSYSGGARPYYVSGMDCVSFGYLMACTPILGGSIYGRLLKEAGVNSVDPTDPSTFLITKDMVKTITPTWSGVLSSHYNECKIDRSKLTPDRIAVLNAAAEMAYEAPFFYGSTQSGKGYLVGHFYWCTIRGNQLVTSGDGDTGFGTDCAHFCGLAYYYAGFKVTYASTSDMQGSGYYKVIPFSDAKPGDILLRPGSHAVIYLCGKSLSSVSTIEAAGRKHNSYDEQVSIFPHRSMAGAIVLRHKDIDKNKRGTPISIPHKKPKTAAEQKHPYGSYQR